MAVVYLHKTKDTKVTNNIENPNSICYVARINEIKPIPGTDNIEQGVIGGWNCIIKINFKIVFYFLLLQDLFKFNVHMIRLKLDKDLI